MNEFLKHYKIKLNTIGPVFVGNGKELMKKEYVLNKRERKVTIIDQRKFFNYLMDTNRLDKYEQYILKGKSLKNWLDDEKVSKSDLRSFTAYEYDCGGVADLNQMKNILTFMKSPYGNPYIPGSSLKGAIRTALLGADIMLNPSKYNHTVDYFKNDFMHNQNKRDVERNIKNAEIKCFCTKNKSDKNQVVNDIMNGLRISDSDELSLDDLTLCQKIDINTKGGEGDLPILRECLKPGTQIEFDMSIDTDECYLTIEDIMNSINVFLKGYNTLFLEKFKNETLYDKDVLYLGGGVGFATKTVVHELLCKSNSSSRIISNIIDLNLPKKMRNAHNHYNDAKFGVSPHTCKLTEYDGYLMQMGPCNIEIV